MDGSSKSTVKQDLINRIFDTMEYGPAPESDAAANEWLDKHQRRFGQLIDGKWVPGTEHFPTINPGRKQKLADITQGTEADVDAAVKAATRALPGWQSLGAHGRARFLYAIARAIQKHSRLFAVLESLDNGKPIRESRDIDVPLAARHFYHHAGWAQLMEKEMPDHVPLGVVGQIIPWNFPMLMLAWKIAPALAMGNTLVLKPAELTPLTALFFGEICQEVGLPPGVVNLVTGDGRTGAAITKHAGVAKVAFTGSTEVGRIIREATAGSGKKLSLELGGKSPFMVFEDADLDSVVEGVVDAIWFNQGQVCCAGSRILAQESIAERLLAKLRARMETLRIGDPLDKCDRRRLDRRRRPDRTASRGWSSGPRRKAPALAALLVAARRGWFYPPTDAERRPAREHRRAGGDLRPRRGLHDLPHARGGGRAREQHGFGLASSVWTESINLALDVAPKIKAGTVWVNCTNVFDAAAGFGGYRESGYGREGGKEGLFEYVRPRWRPRRTARSRSPSSRARRHRSRGARVGVRRDGPGPAVDGSHRQALHRWQAGASRRRLLAARARRRRHAARSGRPRQPQGHPQRGRGRHAASGWARQTAHLRAQVLYYLAENLSARQAELAARIAKMTGHRSRSQLEVELAIERLFTYAAWADKYDGLVHATPHRNVTVAMNEPIGTIGIVTGDAAPLLQFVSLVAPAIAMGNTVVVVPSEKWPLAATDLYQVLDTSDVPGGVVNIVTGTRAELTPVLAGHDGIDSIWYHGPRRSRRRSRSSRRAT
jgi:aldehyde dehydrogenase (NAD+)